MDRSIKNSRTTANRKSTKRPAESKKTAKVQVEELEKKTLHEARGGRMHGRGRGGGRRLMVLVHHPEGDVHLVLLLLDPATAHHGRRTDGPAGRRIAATASN